MKRLLVICLVAFFLAGCGRVTRSDFMQHDTMYRSWNHLAFSWFGYRNVSPEEARMSQQQDWWGLEVPYVPGQ